MSTILRLSSSVPRAILVRWFQPGHTLRLDCTSFTMQTHETGLPFVPVWQAVDLEAGEFRIAPATPEQLALLRPGRQYGLHALLLNALGEPVDDMRLMIEAV